MLNRRYLHKPPSLWVRNGKKFFTEKILNKNISHNRLLSPVFLQNIGEEMVLIVICPDSLPSSATHIFRTVLTVHIFTPVHLAQNINKVFKLINFDILFTLYIYWGRKQMSYIIILFEDFSDPPVILWSTQKFFFSQLPPSPPPRIT